MLSLIIVSSVLCYTNQKTLLNKTPMLRALLSIAFLIWTYTFCSAQEMKSFYNDSIQLFYDTHGSGPALYILSGGPGEAPDHPYHLIIDSLKSRYTCVLLHQRGSGKSRNMPINSSTINIQKYTEDIELLRQERKDKKIILMGVSWGGLLAMNYAANFPDHVSNLLLVSSAPPSHTVWNVLFDNQYARRSQSELDSMELLQKIFSTKTEKELDSLKRVNTNSKEVLAYKAFIDIHVRAMYYDRSKISPKNLNDLFYNFNFQPIPIIDQEVLETKWDITAKLKKLKTPALIVYGRQDDQGESTFYLQKESLLFSEMHVIEQCGHEILEEQADAFFGVLRGYLGGR